jgi:hypothetical protein
MADELPETADAAIRAYLFAIGFTLVLIGGELMAEKDGTRFSAGLALVAIALPVHLTWVFWTRLKPRLAGTGLLPQASAVATSIRWWLGALFIALAALVFAPVIQSPRWPSWPKTTLSTIPTSLRLQFNARGTIPQEIGRQNIEWTFASPMEKRLTGKNEQKLCEPQSFVLTPGALGAGATGTPRCNTIEIPEYADVPNWIIFLSFTDPITAKDIKLDTHGAQLPKWEVNGLSEHGAYVYFHGDLIRMVVDRKNISGCTGRWLQSEVHGRFSPRAWGTPDTGRIGHVDLRFSPTRVGNTRPS